MHYAKIRHEHGEDTVYSGVELQKRLHELQDQKAVVVNYPTGFFEVYTIENKRVRLKTNSIMEGIDSWTPYRSQ